MLGSQKEVKWPVLSWNQPALSANPEMDRKGKAGGETQPGWCARGHVDAGGLGEAGRDNQCLVHVQCPVSHVPQAHPLHHSRFVQELLWTELAWEQWGLGCL